MMCRFGIVPDGADEPAAVFQDLEDAMLWGLEKFGAEKFSIRRCAMAEVRGDDEGLSVLEAVN